MILILDDDPYRLERFKQLADVLSGQEIISWTNAPSMIAEVDKFLAEARLISLDHDLYRPFETAAEPGTGRDVADHLATQKPVCPIIIHSTNVDAAWGMHNVLSYAGWEVTMQHFIDDAWFEYKWLPCVISLAGL